MKELPAFCSLVVVVACLFLVSCNVTHSEEVPPKLVSIQLKDIQLVGADEQMVIIERANQVVSLDRKDGKILWTIDRAEHDKVFLLSKQLVLLRGYAKDGEEYLAVALFSRGSGASLLRTTMRGLCMAYSAGGLLWETEDVACLTLYDGTLFVNKKDCVVDVVLMGFWEYWPLPGIAYRYDHGKLYRQAGGWRSNGEWEVADMEGWPKGICYAYPSAAVGDTLICNVSTKDKDGVEDFTHLALLSKDKNRIIELPYRLGGTFCAVVGNRLYGVGACWRLSYMELDTLKWGEVEPSELGAYWVKGESKDGLWVTFGESCESESRFMKCITHDGRVIGSAECERDVETKYCSKEWFVTGDVALMYVDIADVLVTGGYAARK